MRAVDRFLQRWRIRKGGPPGARIIANRRLLLPGLAFLSLALGFEVLWLARNPQPDDGMVFSIGRLGLRLTLSRAGFEAFALAAGALALGSVAWAYFAARAAVFGRGAVSHRGSGEAEGAGTEIGNRKSEIGNRTWRLGLAAVLLVACAVPLHMVVGWADGAVSPYVHYGAEWHRRGLFRELGFSGSRHLLWLGALLALGAWVLRTRGRDAPPTRWCELAWRALEAIDRSPRRRVVAIACGAFLALALAYTALVTRGLPDNPDAYGYMFMARTYASGRLWSPLPASRDFFDPRRCPHPVELGYVFEEAHAEEAEGQRGARESWRMGPKSQMGGRWYYCPTPLAPLVYAAGVLAGCVWLIPPLLGAAAVGLTYLLGKEVFGQRAGLVALGLAAACGWLLIQSAHYLTHLPCLVLLLVFAIAAIRALTAHSSLRVPPCGAAALAGLALGLAAATRPVSAAAFSVPFAVVWLAWLARSPRTRWVPTLAFGAAVALPVAGLLAYNAATTGHALTFGYQAARAEGRVAWASQDLVTGWQWRPAVGVAHLLHLAYSYGQEAWHWPVPALGVVLAACALLGLWGRGAGRGWPLVLGLAALCVALAYARNETMEARYAFEVLPVVAVLGGGAAVGLHERLAARGMDRRLAAGLLGAVLVFCVGYDVASRLAWEFPRYGLSLETPGLARAVAAAAKPAIVFVPVTPSSDATYRFTAIITQNDPGMHGPVVYVRDLAERNHEVVECYPGRSLYRWDAEWGVLTPLAPSEGGRSEVDQ